MNYKGNQSYTESSGTSELQLIILELAVYIYPVIQKFKLFSLKWEFWLGLIFFSKILAGAGAGGGREGEAAQGGARKNLIGT